MTTSFDGGYNAATQVGACSGKRYAPISGMSGAQLIESPCPYGEGSGEKPVKKHAKAVEVTSDCRGTASEHLRRHLHRRTSRVAVRWRLLHRATGAEVHQDDPTAALTQHVSRLDIPVEKTG